MAILGRHGFFRLTLRQAIRGSRLYYAWLALLLTLVGAGVVNYARQVEEGLIVTAMNDCVSWGAYIANFTFLVGLAAGAVMLVIPAYLYHYKPFKDVVYIGEFLAIAAVIMSLMFVLADLGRPDRAWHLLPFLGRMNFPQSMIAWDMLVLNGYLYLNLFLVFYALWQKFHGRKPNPRIYLTIIFVSMVWAISIHTVTAFLYSWLGARPFWNSPIVAPRFLVSAFVSGPAFLIIALQIIRRRMRVPIDDAAIHGLRRIVAVTMTINLFLLLSEVFTELYSGSVHGAHARYLFFGHDGHEVVTPYIWTAVAMNVVAASVFIVPALARRPALLNVACVMAFIGIWIEKGMGLLVPGFNPTPLGEYYDYSPSQVEFFVSLGIWGLGLLIFTLLLKVGVEIELGRLRAPDAAPVVEGA